MKRSGVAYSCSYALLIVTVKAVVPPAQTPKIILRDTPVSMGIR